MARLSASGSAWLIKAAAQLAETWRLHRPYATAEAEKPVGRLKLNEEDLKWTPKVLSCPLEVNNANIY
jgi:hypothetical protein